MIDGAERVLWLWQEVVCVSTCSGLRGHKFAVNALASFSPELVVSGSFDSTVKVWTVQGTHVTTLTGHSASITALKVCLHVVEGDVASEWSLSIFSRLILLHWAAFKVFPDGSGRMVTASADKELRVWRRPSKGQLWTCEQVLKGHTKGLTDVAVDPRSGCIYSASYDGTIRSWVDGECVCVMKDHQKGHVVYMVAVTTDGVLVSCGGDKVARLWQGGHCKAVLEGAKGSVNVMLVLADNTLFTGSWDSIVRVWK